MIRLLVHVEGQTEESFVDRVLAPYLCAGGFSSVRARLMGNARQRGHRGGIRKWPAVRRGIVRHLREDRGCTVTTMVDYYGLPQSGDGAWPKRAEASQCPYPVKAGIVEAGMSAEVSGEMGAGFNPRRFVPFLVMHEFEALLFSDCDRFGIGIEQPELAPRFRQVRESFSSPEEIDESPDQAPSKRIERLYPGYQKPLLGTLAALEIGLSGIRAECPHFSDWVSRLEKLPATL